MAALPLMSYRGVYIEPMPPSASKAVGNKSVLEKVQAIADRHGNNYYVGWPDERLAALPECFRPPVGVVPVLPSKTERRDNKMLTWAYKNNPQFTKLLEEGEFCSLNRARAFTSLVWKASPEYSGKHATTIPNTGLKRRRGEDLKILLARHEFRSTLGLCKSRPTTSSVSTATVAAVKTELPTSPPPPTGEEIRRTLMGERKDELELLYRTVTLDQFIEKIVGMIVT